MLLKQIPQKTIQNETHNHIPHFAEEKNKIKITSSKQIQETKY